MTLPMLPETAKPYLIRAIYDWCLAEGHTPHILAAVDQPGVRVPTGYAKDNRITLNLSPRSVQNLELGLDRVRFAARFGASTSQVELPLAGILAIFAAETHEGIVFGDPNVATTPQPTVEAAPVADEDDTLPEPSSSSADAALDQGETPPADDEGKSHLRLVD